MKYFSFIIGLLVIPSIVFAQGAPGASSPLWYFPTDTIIAPIDDLLGIRVPSLPSCGSLSTDGDGDFACGGSVTGFSTTSADYWLTLRQGAAWSTTSADYWDTTKWRWSTTSAAYFLSQNQGNAWSTTSANFWSSLGYGWSTTSANHFINSTSTFSTTSSNAWLGTKTTDNLTQGVINLYYADSLVRTYLDTLGKGYYFSTTSADFWASQGLGWSTTSANFWSSLGYGWSTTSANAWSALGYGFSTTSILAFLANNPIDLAASTTGVLTVPKGGTASTSLGGILRGDGTSAVASVLIGSGLTFDGTTLSATGGASIADAQTSKWATSTGLVITPNGGGGILVNASSTIGAGRDGLTVFGNSTTTHATTTNSFSTTASSTSLFSSVLSVGATTTLATSGGRVGIGTSSPLMRLSIEDTSALQAQILLKNTNASAVANGFLVYDELGAIAVQFGQNNLLNETYFFAGANLPFKIGTNNTERLRILSGGNVGIGNATPLERLSIWGRTSSDAFLATSTAMTTTLAGGLTVSATTTLAQATTTTLAISTILSCNTTSALTTNATGGVVCGTVTGTGDGTFSTTSANFWASLGYGWSTTSADAWSALGYGHSTTSTNYLLTQYAGNLTYNQATGTTIFNTTASSTSLFASSLAIGGNRLVTGATGNIGIGTTTPVAKLNITPTGNGNTVLIDRVGDGTLNGYWGFGTSNAANTDHLIVGYTGSGYAGVLAWIGASNSFIYYPTTFRIGTGVGLTPTMAFTSTGLVGIGTSSPATRLHVTNGASATTTITVGSLNVTTSKSCVNMNRSDGTAASFYINAAGTMVVETNYCR